MPENSNTEIRNANGFLFDFDLLILWIFGIISNFDIRI